MRLEVVLATIGLASCATGGLVSVDDPSCKVENVTIQAVPAYSGESYFHVMHPSPLDVPDSYTGCITFWTRGGTLASRAMYKGGNLVQLIRYRPETEVSCAFLLSGERVPNTPVCAPAETW